MTLNIDEWDDQTPSDQKLAEASAPSVAEPSAQQEPSKDIDNEHEMCAMAVCELLRVYDAMRGAPELRDRPHWESAHPQDRIDAIAAVARVMRGDAPKLSDDPAREGLTVRTIRSFSAALGWSGAAR